MWERVLVVHSCCTWICIFRKIHGNCRFGKLKSTETVVLVHLTRCRLIKHYINSSYLEQGNLKEAKGHTIWRDHLGPTRVLAVVDSLHKNKDTLMISNKNTGSDLWVQVERTYSIHSMCSAKQRVMNFRHTSENKEYPGNNGILCLWTQKFQQLHQLTWISTKQMWLCTYKCLFLNLTSL